MDHSTAYKLIVEYLSQRFGVPLEKIKPDSKMFDDECLDFTGLKLLQERCKMLLVSCYRNVQPEYKV